jgi:hypothetical protein
MLMCFYYSTPLKIAMHKNANMKNKMEKYPGPDKEDWQ